MNWLKKVLAPFGMCVFHHIPKCGGTSLLTALPQWFTVIYDYRDFDGNISLPINLDKLTCEHCLCGHFDVDGIFLHQRYPTLIGKRKYRLFTFVRDPLELKISLYYYEKLHGMDKGLTLEESLFIRQNYMANRFPCTLDNYRKVIDRYSFVGIVENSQESMDKLANLLDKPLIQLRCENQTGRDMQYQNLSPTLVDKFKNQNKLDYLIYDYCYSVNSKICS